MSVFDLEFSYVEEIDVEMRIPIVMVTDTNYVTQTRVAIWTMRKSTCADVILDITILCSDQLDTKSRNRLNVLESKFCNLTIRFYEIDSGLFVNARTADRIPVTSFYRLVIPEVLKDEEKCLFLDGDIIVNEDLQTLYLQELHGAYIAGVRDNEFMYQPESAISHLDACEVKAMNSYVNAGVMIFNLSKLREDNIQKQFLKCMEKHYPYMDQDILNKVCEGKIKLLDPRYNYINRRRNEWVPFLGAGCGGKADQPVGKQCEWKILHFAGSHKPWNNDRVRDAGVWWKWAKEALEKDTYDNIFREAQERAGRSDWTYLLERCENEKVIIIIGYSRIGIDAFTSLKRCKVEGELLFGDNSKAKQGLGDDTIVIYPVNELAVRYPDALWINTSQRRTQEITCQLKAFGIGEERIIEYVYKDEDYFEMLDDRYIDYELQQLRRKNMGTV